MDFSSGQEQSKRGRAIQLVQVGVTVGTDQSILSLYVCDGEECDIKLKIISITYHLT